ncbi:hypothetical protein EYF80_062526 [Liparis tanakae]|uniref:Uncharacterized protein n=1 Tax=Liparis tanakae TaxID=230148 RepID=A0A4Z2EFM6_9TELE|nr:hypothetical protein EYF80_062526 [Liparis tanakae]
MDPCLLSGSRRTADVPFSHAIRLHLLPTGLCAKTRGGATAGFPQRTATVLDPSRPPSGQTSGSGFSSSLSCMSLSDPVPTSESKSEWSESEECVRVCVCPAEWMLASLSSRVSVREKRPKSSRPLGETLLLSLSPSKYRSSRSTNHSGQNLLRIRSQNMARLMSSPAETTQKDSHARPAPAGGVSRACEHQQELEVLLELTDIMRTGYHNNNKNNNNRESSIVALKALKALQKDKRLKVWKAWPEELSALRML